MGRDNIEKYSTGYSLLKFFASLWHNRVFYRRVIVYGRDNIDPTQHNIFAPNHQNALMDALAVTCTTKGQIVFLARSDIFRKKLIASILYFLKMLPVYRIRDGYDQMKNNDATFLKTIDIIKNKNGIGILPEGNHAGFRRLRQLKKGICRIAFQTEEACDYSLNIKIIPVGLEFTNYNRFRQVLTVVYGKPISVSEYYDSYRENPPKAMNELRDRLSSEMKKLLVHIESEEDYEAIDEMRSIINGKYSDRIKIPKLFRDRILINKLSRLSDSNNELYRKACNISLAVKKKAVELGLGYRVLGKNKNPLFWLLMGAVLLIATLPLFLFGAAFNIVFLQVPKLPLRNIPDSQFHSSIKYGLSLVLAFIILPIYTVLALIFISPLWLALVVAAVIPLSGLFAWNWKLLFLRVGGGLKVWYYRITGNKEYYELRDNFNELNTIIYAL